MSLLGILFLLSASPFTGFAADRRIKPQAPAAGEILEAEQRLAALGYWTGPVDGVFDARSRHALVAFQKVEGRKRTGKLTSAELGALRPAVRPLPRATDYSHVEIDLQRQVLFVVGDNGEVTHILPVCTGNEKSYVDHGEVHRAHTPRGQFKVIRKIRGPRISSLGLLYYPNYIYEGIAIHGSWAMPTYPDSHGCIRIPMFVAKAFSELLPLGTEVIVY
ncbi:MAG TPA: L,D-transpeptidase family protein [Pyrinomonadaceae bacterium]|nr:L,D-transpeptidase family protein [Pyrinomonadaceae bacterium]